MVIIEENLVPILSYGQHVIRAAVFYLSNKYQYYIHLISINCFFKLASCLKLTITDSMCLVINDTVVSHYMGDSTVFMSHLTDLME